MELNWSVLVKKAAEKLRLNGKKCYRLSEKKKELSLWLQVWNKKNLQCLQAMNGHFDWFISEHQSVNPSGEAISILPGKYKRFTFVHVVLSLKAAESDWLSWLNYTLKATFHLTVSIRGQRATGKSQRNNYRHGSCGPSLTGKTSSVSLIFTHGTHRNFKNR